MTANGSGLGPVHFTSPIDSSDNYQQITTPADNLSRLACSGFASY